jgi:pyruvate,water dikinase
LLDAPPEEKHMTSPDSSRPEAWDPLHSESPPDAYWSTSNFGEAMPGVMTPLGWTFWGPTADKATRAAFGSMGALTRAEALPNSDPQHRVASIFYGRVAGRVDFLVTIGDRLPGTTGVAVAEQVVGAMPVELTSSHTFRRYPIIATRFPYSFATINRRSRKISTDTSLWWHERIGAVESLTRAEATAQFVEANDRFDRNVVVQGIHVLCAVQPVFDQLTKLVQDAGLGDATAFMSGYGAHAESAIVTDMWAASRGLLPVDEVARRHGYHGPNEGEISGRVWREDDRGLRKLLDGYRSMPDSADPALVERAKRSERQELEERLLSSLPRHRRPSAKLILRLAAAVIPVRGVGKSAFLQSLDMGRASARRIGALLVEEGRLENVEDVFYLTTNELADPPQDAPALVGMRRERRHHYETLQIPSAWLGQPTATVAVEAAERGLGDVVHGVGASPGVVEGVVRVVTDPDDDEVVPGEILVAPTTDPSWASIMFLSGALVVDIGGALSHAAIVARELGIPCVVNTGSGSRLLRTGDVVRVDGAAGRVDVVKHAE